MSYFAFKAHMEKNSFGVPLYPEKFRKRTQGGVFHLEAGDYIGSDNNTYNSNHYQINPDDETLITGDDGNPIVDPDYLPGGIYYVAPSTDNGSGSGDDGSSTPSISDNPPPITTDDSGSGSGGDGSGSGSGSGDGSGSGGGGGGNPPSSSTPAPTTPTISSNPPVIVATPVGKGHVGSTVFVGGNKLSSYKITGPAISGPGSGSGGGGGISGPGFTVSGGNAPAKRSSVGPRLAVNTVVNRASKF